jgi:hypothetical protein
MIRKAIRMNLNLRLINMKRLLVIIFACMITLPAFTQEDTVKVNSEVIKVKDEQGKASVIITGEEIIAVDENKDTTKIKIGKKGLSITEDKEGTKIIIKDLDERKNEKNHESDEHKSHKDKGFKGHWAGFQVGLNNYVNSDFSMSLDNNMNYMDLNTGKSWSYGLNVMQYSFGFGTDKIGMVTGLGIEWSNYIFDKDSTIRQDENGIIQPHDVAYLGSVQKNRLQTTYLNVPLLLEFQIPAGKKRIYFSGGLIGGVKLGSNTKIVYKDNGDKRKIKDKNDYNLSALRYGLTARAGYRGLNLFATYYITPLFEPNKGPELYPFYIGLALIIF